MSSAADQPAPAASTQDALQLIEGDHRRIRALIVDLLFLSDGTSAPADRQGLLARLAALLKAHGRIEREILYPALVGRAEPARLARAPADHDAIDALLEDLAGDASAADFSERMARLADAVQAHLDEEERDLLPHAVGLDVAGLGVELALRRGALQADAAPD
jgi:hypothetical protein